MTASQLVVPVVLWGRDAPTHCVSSVLMTPDAHTIATGCNDGQICLWNVTDDWKVTPHCMLFGHTAAINCLCMGSNQADKPYLVSASDNGEMCLWDLSDGRCIEHKKHPMVHTGIQSYQMMHCRDVRLICNGYYTDIHIIHPSSLEILFTLSSRMQPDWISALSILRPVKREDDVVVAISNSGMVKVWTLTGNESKSTQPIYENEAKQIRCLNAQSLRCCAYNQRTVLIVCSKYWQIYDAGDFSVLCSESSRCGERWAGGEFIGVDRVVVWSNEGRGYLYKLPTNCHPESESFHHPADPSSPRQQGPQAYNILDMFGEKSLECSPAMTYFLGRREHERKLLLRGDSEGRLLVWVIPDIHEKKMRLVRQESFEKLPVNHPKCCTSLQEAWEGTEPPPQGIIDQLNNLGERTLQITATIYIPSCGRLVCGRDDGSIVIVPAVEAIALKLLLNGKNEVYE